MYEMPHYSVPVYLTRVEAAHIPTLVDICLFFGRKEVIKCFLPRGVIHSNSYITITRYIEQSLNLNASLSLDHWGFFLVGGCVCGIFLFCFSVSISVGPI